MSLFLDPRLTPRRRYLLGISGGRDSVALLNTLLETGASKLILCHLNHQLRGLFSSHDAAFVRELAEAHALPFEIARANMQRRSEEEKISLEVAARRARHEFFADCARRHSCSRILLAHHADDNAETILLNLLRGSSGLRGMQFESELTVNRRKLKILRPFLEVRRSSIDAYLEENSIPFREDETNREPFTPRNRLRSEILPLLGEIMGRDIVPAMVRASHANREDQEALGQLMDLLALVDPQGRLFLPKLRMLPEALQRHAFFRYLKGAGVPDLSRSVIDRCRALLDPEAPSKVSLPGECSCRRRANRIFVE